MLTIYIIIFIGIVCVSLVLYKKSEKENNLKKKIFFSIPTLAYCFIIIVMFVSIIFSDSKLNYVEEQVYNRVISMVNEEGFFNPKEAKLLDVVVEYKYSDVDREYSDTVDSYYIKIIGTNKVGGTINKCYKIYLWDNEWESDEKKCKYIYKTGLSYEQLSSNSIKKINQAMQKYWEDFGL